MTRTRLLPAVLAVALVPLLGACGGSDSAGSSGASAAPSSVAAPTGSPFGVTLEGPDVAAAGDTVTATLTNTGRLPDSYQLQSDPQGAVTFPPGDVRLGPGESVDVELTVAQVPALVRVRSISPASGSGETYLSIGARQ